MSDPNESSDDLEEIDDSWIDDLRYLDPEISDEALADFGDAEGERPEDPALGSVGDTSALGEANAPVEMNVLDDASVVGGAGGSGTAPVSAAPVSLPATDEGAPGTAGPTPDRAESVAAARLLAEPSGAPVLARGVGSTESGSVRTVVINDDNSFDSVKAAGRGRSDDGGKPKTKGKGRRRGIAPEEISAVPTASPRTVVISDDDDPIDLSALPSKAQLDPRVRKRRIAVKREAGRRRFRLVIVLGALGAVVVGGLVVLASPIFSVKQVDVVGAAYTSGEQLASIIDEVVGSPTLTVDPKKVQADVEALPWVRRAEVAIGFPRTVTIRIAERSPAATYRGIDGRWRIVDRAARVLAIEVNQPADFLPVSGSGPDLEPGETAGVMIATLAELAEVIGDLPRLDGLVIALSAEGTDLTMTLASPGGTGIQVILGTVSQLRTKLSVLLTILDDGDRDLDEVLQINLTDPAKYAIG